MDVQSEVELLKREPIWIAPTLTNSWANYSAVFNDAAYGKNGFGQVFLRGLVKSGTSATAIFTLPIGYRPIREHIFIVDAAEALGRIDVFPGGEVKLIVGSNGYVSLDGISFFTN